MTARKQPGVRTIQGKTMLTTHSIEVHGARISYDVRPGETIRGGALIRRQEPGV